MGGGQRFLRIVLPGFGAEVCDLASLADDGAAGKRVLAAHRPKKIDREINDLGQTETSVTRSRCMIAACSSKPPTTPP